MIFPTISFIIFYIIVITLYLVVSSAKNIRKYVLLLSSYIFYAAWDWRFLALLVFVSFIAWCAGLILEREGPKYRIKLISISSLLIILGLFKYYNFFILSLQDLFRETFLERDLLWLSFILPLGISFYIFQAISYIFDVDRKQLSASKDFANVALYISFFPQLVAGPIVRASSFFPQIKKNYSINQRTIAEAILLISIGLFKKIVIANYLAILIVDPVFGFPEEHGSFDTLLAVLAYAVQIYCDFSGYSDMAIGLALLLGYRFQPNFNQPYSARSLKDFWGRWHISLSSWIRDYLYIPLGGNKGSKIRQAIVLLVTMSLAGLWHGASWNFLVWGALHGTALSAERLLSLDKKLPFYRYFTIIFVLSLWIPFRSGTWDETENLVASMFSGIFYFSNGYYPQITVLVTLGFLMNFIPIRWMPEILKKFTILPAVLKAVCFALLILLCFACAQDGVAPFIYFQF